MQDRERKDAFESRRTRVKEGYMEACMEEVEGGEVAGKKWHVGIDGVSSRVLSTAK